MISPRWRILCVSRQWLQRLGAPAYSRNESFSSSLSFHQLSSDKPRKNRGFRRPVPGDNLSVLRCKDFLPFSRCCWKQLCLSTVSSCSRWLDGQRWWCPCEFVNNGLAAFLSIAPIFGIFYASTNRISFYSVHGISALPDKGLESRSAII